MGETRRRTSFDVRVEHSRIRENMHNNSRRQTTAGITAQKLSSYIEKPSLRIEKSRDTKRRETQKSEAYATSFQGQLHAYKREFISSLNEDLSETDTILSDLMSTLSANFEERCDVIENAATNAQASLESEALMVEGENGKEIEISLGDAMKTFAQLYGSSKERLEQLWVEYEQTQRSIMELALAVLNDNRVRIKYSSLDAKTDTADPRLDEDKAQEQRDEARTLYDEAVADLDGLKENVGEQVKVSLKENDEILRNFKRQITHMQKEMQKMLKDIQGQSP